MAVHTALAFAALAAGLVLARPSGRIVRLATTSDPGGVMVRRLLPFTIFVPLLLGWIQLRSVQRGIFS